MSDLSAVLGEPVQIPQETAEQAPPQAQEASPAPQEGQQGAEGAHEAPESKVVPLAALHEERARRRELQQRLEANEREAQAWRQRAEERINAILQAQRPQTPSLEENPAVHLNSKLDGVSRDVQAITGALTEAQRAAQVQQQVAALENVVRTREAEFAKEHPDFEAAVKFFYGQRTQELQIHGLDQVAALQQAAHEFRVGALQAAANGQNPAEMAYRMAQARGYRKADPAPAVSAEDKFNAQAKGAAAAKSLGGGGASSGTPSLQALLAMSDEDFAEATKGNKWSKIMG